MAGLGGWYLGVERPRQQVAAEAQRVATEAAQAAAEKARASEEKARAAEQERQAKVKAEAGAYAALGTSKTEEALKGFLAAHPNGAHFAEAKAEYEGLAAERQRKEAEAKKRVEEEAAREAARQAKLKEEFDAYVVLQANKTEAGLTAFLERFPDGTHAKAVTNDLARMREEKARQEAETKRLKVEAEARERETAAAAARKVEEEKRQKEIIGNIAGNWQLEAEFGTVAAVIKQEDDSAVLAFDFKGNGHQYKGTYRDGLLSVTESSHIVGRAPALSLSANHANFTMYSKYEGKISSDGRTIRGTQSSWMRGVNAWGNSADRDFPSSEFVLKRQ